MRAIYKFQLGMAEKATVKMHKGAKVIRVNGIDGFLYLWAVVDPAEDLEERDFYLFKTGAAMPDDILEKYLYLGCGGIFVQMELMMYVWEKVRV